MSPLPPNFIANLNEFKPYFSQSVDTYSRQLRLLISLANGHPRTLEAIHSVIEKTKEHLELAKAFDFNKLFNAVTTEISKRYIFQNFECDEIFLYRFIAHAFFVPNESFNINLDKEFHLVETLVEKAIIVDSIKKQTSPFMLFCKTQINLYTFCSFWFVVTKKPECDWVINLNNLLTINQETTAQAVCEAFLDPLRFEQYFSLISIFRFNLLVNSICDNIASRYTTLGSFFELSNILGEEHSTYRDWAIDFSKPFCVANSTCGKEMFINLIESDNWDANVNIWFSNCEKIFHGIDTFCFLNLTSEFKVVYFRAHC